MAQVPSTDSFTCDTLTSTI